MANNKEMLKGFTDHSYGPWKKQKDWKSPVCIAKAEGVHLYDEDG